MNKQGKIYKSQINVNPNKITSENVGSLQELLDDITLAEVGLRESMDSSYLMADDTNWDIGTGSGFVKRRTRIHTSKGAASPKPSIKLNIEPVIRSGMVSRYSPTIKQNYPASIVANARKELQFIKRSQLPRNS